MAAAGQEEKTREQRGGREQSMLWQESTSPDLSLAGACGSVRGGCCAPVVVILKGKDHSKQTLQNLFY